MRGVVGVTELIVDLPQRLIRLITTIKQQQQQLVVDIRVCLTSRGQRLNKSDEI
jgi:hypothetical protein